MTAAVRLAPPPEPNLEDVPATPAATDLPPPGALTWASSKDKAAALRRWRDGCLKRIDREARLLKLAWRLEGLFGPGGYAFPTNGHLVAATGIPANKINDALQGLEEAGAIIRTRVKTPDGRFQRRLYPAAAIAEKPRKNYPMTGHFPSPVMGYPVTGDHRKNITRRARESTVQALARQESARKDARARGESVPSWMSDDG